MASTAPDYNYEMSGLMLTFSAKLPQPKDDKNKEEGKTHPTHKQTVSEKVSEKILRAIRQDKQVTIAELADKNNVAARTIERHLKRLQESGIIQRIGSARSGHWEIQG